MRFSYLLKFETTLKKVSVSMPRQDGQLASAIRDQDHQTRPFLNHNEEGDVDIKWQAYKAKTVLHY